MALNTDTNFQITFNDKFTKYTVYNIEDTGATPAISKAIKPVGPYRLHGIRVISDADITTSENLTITMDMNVGAGFDHIVFKKDLSTVISATELFYEYRFDPAHVYAALDQMTIAFANTDANNIAIQLIIEERY